MEAKVVENPAPPDPMDPQNAAYCGGDPIPSIRVDDPGDQYTVKWYVNATGSTMASGSTAGKNGEIFTPSMDATATYYAEVEIDATGCVSINRLGITITRNPASSSPANPIGANYCSGESIPSIRVDDPGNGITVKWYTSLTGSAEASGTISGNNGEIFTPNSDATITYYAELVSDETGCISITRTTVTVTRYPLPAAASNPQGASFCSGDPTPPIRVNDPGTGLTIKWYTTATGNSVATGTTSGLREEIFTPDIKESAIYYAAVVNNTSGCTSANRVAVNLTANTSPSAPVNPIGASYCDGSPVPSIQVNNPGTGYVVNWYSTIVGNIQAAGILSGSNGEVFTPQANQSATYFAEVENETTGCTSNTRTTVSVVKLSAPFPPSNPIGNQYCSDEPIPSIRVNDPGNGLTIVWYTNTSGTTFATGMTTGNNGEIFTPANNSSATYYAAVEDDVTGCINLTRVGVPVVKNTLPPNASNPVGNSYCPGQGLPTINVDNPGDDLEVYWFDSATDGNLAKGTTGGLNGEQFTPDNPGTAVYYAEVIDEITGCISAGRLGVVLSEDPLACKDTEILSFSFKEQKNSTIFDKINHKIELDVRYGTPLTNLIAYFTLPLGATAEVNGMVQESGSTINDFTNDLIYTVISADGVTTQDWTVSVDVALNDSTDILRYSLDEQTGPALIDYINHRIDLEVAFGTDLSDLVASFELSTGAIARVDGVLQQNGITSNDFFDIVRYRIIAADMTTTQDWDVKVTEAPNSETDFISYTIPEQIFPTEIDHQNNIIIIIVSTDTDVTDLVANFTLSDGAVGMIDGVAQESGVTANDFRDMVVYTVISEDGKTSKDWRVTIVVQDILDNEDPVITEGLIPEEYPVGMDSIPSSVMVTDNVRVRRVVFRYKRYQDLEWKENMVRSNGTTYRQYIQESEVGNHGIFYYFKAWDDKNNTDSTGIKSLVLRYTDQNSPEIENLIFGSVAESYQILSLPYDLENNRVENVFEELMPYDIKRWRLFHYDNGITGEYGEGFSRINPGRGYWLIVRNQTSIQVGGERTVRIEDEEGFSTVLQPGWNQVGNPYNFEISWDDVIDFNNNPNLGRIKLYENGILMESDKVPQFRGGFVFLSGVQSAFLNIPPNPGFKIARLDRNGKLAKPNPKDQAGWLLPITISSGNYTNRLYALGMHPESLTGFDVKDEPLLPIPHEISGFDLYFVREGESYDKLNRDIVSPAEFQTWVLELNNYNGAGNIILKWDNKLFANNPYELIMLDETNGRMVDMQASDTYTFYATKIHHFRIFYGTKDRLMKEILPLKLQIGEIYPNPFDNELNIPVSIPDQIGPLQIELSLSDLSGRVVQNRSDIQVNPGYQQISWKLDVPDQFLRGFYFLKILIASEKEKQIIYKKILRY